MSVVLCCGCDTATVPNTPEWSVYPVAIAACITGAGWLWPHLPSFLFTLDRDRGSVTTDPRDHARIRWTRDSFLLVGVLP